VGLLEFLGLKKPPPADPIFQFKKFYGFQQPYWEAKAAFSPIGRLVEVLIECPRTGADSGQHTFFRELEVQYDEVLSAAYGAIAEQSSQVDSSFAAPSKDALRLLCVSLPPTPPTAEWELSFEDAEGIHYAVAFENWRPARVEIEPC
jgi:hypothetical protein